MGFWNRWRRSKDDTVIVCNLETMTFFEVRRSELGRDMIPVEMEGREDVVWVKASSVKPHPIRHPPFPEELRGFLRQIKEALDEVYPLSLELWEDGFRRDREPAPEIALWLRIANLYKNHSGSARSLAEKQDIFKVLLACSKYEREMVRPMVDLTELSGRQADRVIAVFFGDR